MLLRRFLFALLWVSLAGCGVKKDPIPYVEWRHAETQRPGYTPPPEPKAPERGGKNPWGPQ